MEGERGREGQREIAPQSYDVLDLRLDD